MALSEYPRVVHGNKRSFQNGGRGTGRGGE